MFATYSGVLINPAKMQIEDINLIDIAHHLTNICRYGGGLDFDQHYSVAEHSCLLASYVLEATNDVEIAKYALMHDASEAYLGDVVSGLKDHLDDYKKVESAVSFLIYEKYNVRVVYEDFVGGLDKRILLNEVMALTPHRYQLVRRKGLEPLGINHLAVNDNDYGTFRPGFVPKQVVFDEFLRLCKLFKIED